MAPPERVRAFVAERDGDEVRRGLRELPLAELGEGDVTVRVAWSSVNYKDGLATIAEGRVARISPLVPGIDLAGDVVESDDPGLPPGTAVVAIGHDIGVAHHGGYADYARLPAAWVLPLPDGLSARDAMRLGTAGFTAALAVDALERHGLAPGAGPVLVTGASGGLGSAAVSMLAGRGHEVWASTGSAEAHGWLRELGAAGVLERAETSAESRRPLESERWAAAVDPVGGAAAAYVLRTLRYGGASALCGLTGGAALPTTVMPFILRGVGLLGIDSVQCRRELRARIWGRLAGDLRPAILKRDDFTRTVDLEELEPVLDAILRGETRGRVAVRLAGASA